MWCKRRSRNFKTKLVYSLTAILLITTVCIIVDQGYILHVIKSEYFRCIHGYVGSDTNISSWAVDRVQMCEGNFEGYGHEFAVLNNVMLSGDLQSFGLLCRSRVQYTFNYGKEGTHLNSWMNKIAHFSSAELQTLKRERSVKLDSENTEGSHNSAIDKCARKQFVILVQRYEAANLYHTMTDWYNIFLVSKLLNFSMVDACVLLTGSNIHGILDDVWKTLFIDLAYTSEISSKSIVLFPKLVWSVLGYESPLNYHGRKSVPHLEEFRQFFLSQHSITGNKVLNCDKLRILFLVRRDYVSHPGNKEGVIKRKIFNMDELLRTLKTSFPSAEVIAEQLDQLIFVEQLKIVSETDIIISMHGAGLSHILFLPSHAGVLELYPRYWKKSLFFNHFEMFATWRGLEYAYWQNYNRNNEHENFQTYIPPTVIEQRVQHLSSKICS